MASNAASEEEEGKIPVFTVLKNNAILKNIFILNKPPQPSPSKKPNASSSSVVKDHEDVLLVGRHPDCDIMLTHPSISRFHLHIRSKPSSQSLSLIDLSSVHGTWVSERKVEPGVSVEMNEGDTLRIGASSRVYRLHWIPICRAYDLDDPFVSELDVVLETQNEEQMQNLNCCPDEMEETQSEDSILECIKLLFFDENLEVTVEKEIPAAPPMPEDIFSFCCLEDRKSPSKDEILGFLSEPCGTDTSYLPTTSDWEKELCDSLNQELSVKKEIASATPMPEGIISFCCEEEMKSQSKDAMFGVPSDPFGTENEQCDSLNQVLPLPYVESFAECEGIISFCCEEEMKSHSKDEMLGVPSDPFGTENEHCDSLNQVLPLPFVESFAEREGIISFCCEEEMKSQSKDEMLGVPSDPFGTENELCDSLHQVLPLPYVESFAECEGIISFCCEEEMKSHSKDEMLGVPSDPFGTENEHCDSLNQVLPLPFVESFAEREGIISFCCEEEMKSQSKDEMLGVPSDPFGTENELCDSLHQVLPLPYVESFAECESIISFCCDEEMKSQSKDDMLGVPSDPFGTENELCHSLNQVLPLSYVESFAECVSTLKEYLSESVCLGVVKAVQGTKMQRFHTPPDTFNSSLPPDPATFDGKCAAEAVIPEESECGYTVRDDERDRDTTAAAEIFISENTFLQVEEVVCDTICQQNKVDKEIAMDSLCDGEKQHTCGEFVSHLNAKYCSLDEIVQDIGNKCTDSICPISHQIESVHSSTPQKAVLKITKKNPIPQSDIEFLESGGESKEQKSTIANIWSRRGKAASAPQIRTSKSSFKSKVNIDIKVAMSNLKDITKKTISEDLFSVLDGQEEEEEIFTPDKENFSPNTLQLRFLKKGKLEEIKHSKSKRSHNSKDAFSSDIYPNESISPSPSIEKQKNIIRKTVSKDLFSDLDGEEEIFTPDKENFSPNTLQLRLLKKKGKLEKTKFSKSVWSQNSKENSSPNIYLDERISPTSNKENQTLKVVQEQKSRRKPFGSHIKMVQEQDIMASKNRVERVPFQLLNNTGGKSKSRTSCPVSATKSIDVSDCGQILDKRINFSDISGEAKKSWDMIVDTASLMNRESRKALQLLQGLKGTRLIIPRLVIGELNRMKQQFSIFRRISEASLALEWIEECMVKTNWWIHIQSSMEEESLIAPTPPAFPHTQFGLQCLSFHKSSVELASPTVEDHILDFVLLYRRKQNDGQLILLSEDVTLKIKCMAEGLLCESVQEFRESLANPFSERFLWANSSPRGQTWSCQDDVVLRERYCHLLSKKTSSKGAASGLKLILLHNSQYKH